MSGGLRRRLAAGALVAALSLYASGAAASEVPLPAGPLEPVVQSLAPGDFLWAEKVAPEGPVTIIVSLPLQRAQVYRNGVLIGVSTVSTGKPGHETPTGVFTILQKHAEHYSNLYNSAPMPFMQRLTWDGIALHAGSLPGHPASHGCIRLPKAFAQKLFGVTELGITVIVTDANDLPRLAARESASASDKAGPGWLDVPASGAGGAARMDVEAGATWRPWLQKEGPISLVVSAADKTLRVVRNGVEIGRAEVELGRPVMFTEVYTLAAADVASDRFAWTSVPLAAGQTSVPVSPDERANLMLPEGFRRALAAELVPGATVVVSPDSLKSASYDETLAILEPEEE